MKRETLPPDNGVLLLRIVDILQSIDSKTPALSPGLILLQSIMSFTGSTSKFTVAELFDSGDALLRSSLGDRDAWALGRELGDLEGTVVWGRKLVRKPKIGEGVAWCFEPAPRLGSGDEPE
jgi:hypothetical protein